MIDSPSEPIVADSHPVGALFEGTVTFTVEPDRYPELQLTEALTNLGRTVDEFRKRYGGTIHDVSWSNRQISVSVHILGRTTGMAS